MWAPVRPPPSCGTLLETRFGFGLVTAVGDERPLPTSGATSELPVSPVPPGSFFGGHLEVCQRPSPRPTLALLFLSLTTVPPGQAVLLLVLQLLPWVVEEGKGEGVPMGSGGWCPGLPQEGSALPQRVAFPAQLEELNPVRVAWHTVC